MLEKSIVLITLYASILFHDIPKWKQYKRRERQAYIGLMIATIYLSLIYLTEQPWPNLIDFIYVISNRPVELIMNVLRSTP